MQKYLRLLLPMFLALAGTERSFAAGFDLPLTGRLTEKNGKPVDGPVELSISFFHASKDGAPVLTVTDGLGTVALQEGIFQVSVNLSGSDWQRVFPSADQAVFIEITDLTNAAGTPYPRFQVAMAPLAGKVPVDGKTIAFDGEGRAGLVVAGTQSAGKLLSSDGAGALTWTDPPPTTVTQVSGVSAANVAAGATAANEASSASAVGTIVKRDANGGFAASTVAAQSVILTAPTAASKPLSVKGAAGQTANLQEWLSSTGALLAGVSADGALKLGSGAQSVSLKAPSGMVSSTSYVLPAAPDDGKFLMTDANGNLSWSAPTISSAGLAPSLGSEGAPSYSFSGDTNTGVWSSGADTVNVSTGGAERLRVDASGRVGVGTATPVVTLEVKSSAFSALTGTVDVTSGTTAVVGTGTFFTTETAVGDALRIGSQTLTVAAVADDSHLTLNAAHTAGATAAVAFTDAGLFRVRNAAGTTKLTVNKSGNVGVGALSPEQKLTVDGTLGLLEGGVSPTFHTIFQGGDQAANITYTLPAAQGASGTILTNNGSGVLSWSGATVPGSGTLSTVSGTETLTNKTLTSPVISTISNTGVLTLPTSTDTLVGRDTTDTLTNKTLTAPTINGGTMNASSGAVATPSFSFSGDANTGMWSSAADTVNFSTAGSERLRISSSGNVGIGTTSPSERLDVQGNINVQNTKGIIIDGNATPSISNTAGMFHIRAINNGFSINDVLDTTNWLTILPTGNVGIGTTSPGYPLEVNGTIKATSISDNPGSNANYLLGPHARLRYTGLLGWSSDNHAGNPLDTAIGRNAAGAIEVNNGTAGQYRDMQLRAINPSSGNVGIGTTSPQTVLDISGNTLMLGSDVAANSRTNSTGKVGYFVLPHYTNSQAQVAAFIANSTASANNVYYGGGSSVYNAATALHFYTAATTTTIEGTERMTILGSGNVGIGTTSPVSKLHLSDGSLRITDSSNLYGLTLSNATLDLNGGWSGGVAIGIPGSASRSSLTARYPDGTTLLSAGDHTGIPGTIALATGGTDRLTILNGGNVGIGRTSPAAKLDIATGADSSIGQIIRANSGSQSANLQEWRSSADVPLTVIDSAGSIFGYASESLTLGYRAAWNSTYYPSLTISGNRARFMQTSGGNHFNIYAGDSNNGTLLTTEAGPLRIAPASDLLILSGNVGIGTSVPAEKLQVAGKLRVTGGSGTWASINALELDDDLNNSSVRRWAIVNGSPQLGGLAFRVGTTQTGDPYTNGSTKLLVDSAGNVGIGTTSPATKLDVAGDIQSSGSVWYSGGCSGPCSSDRRLKENIVVVEGALEKIASLTPVYYDYRSKDYPALHLPTDQQVGLIAQEVEEVLPHLVSTDEHGFKRVTYGLELQMQTIAALKELKAKNDALKADNEAIKAYICMKEPQAPFCSH